MAYQRNTELVRFDANTATLFLRITSTDTDLGVLETIEDCPLRLPVDANGFVPTGAELDSLVANFAARQTSPARIAQLIAARRLVELGGVQNPQAIFSVTEELEVDEFVDVDTPEDVTRYSGMIPVILFPDRVFTPSGTSFTRSVMAAVGGEGLPSTVPLITNESWPDLTYTDILAAFTYGLDNGNIISGELRFVQSENQVAPEQAGPLEVTAASSDLLLPPPAYIIAAYPRVFDVRLEYDPITGLAPDGFNFDEHLTYYYIEHDPVYVAPGDTYARAWFTYGGA